MGLREKKKARTKQVILKSAHRLLDSKDYNEITMEEIAESSDIAVGTLYNYFSSKADLLLALILDSDDHYLAEAQSLINSDDDRIDLRLTNVMVLATEYCVRELSKSTWRHVSAAALANANSAMGRMYAETTLKHQTLVVDLMESLSDAGLIRPEVEARSAALSLFSMKSKLFLDFVSDEGMSLETHRKQVLQGVRYFLNGVYRGSKPLGT